jgi:hypothetical protein
MSWCHKHSSKLRSKNTSRTRYLIAKITLPSPMKCKPCTSIYQRAIRIKKPRCNIPSCHRQQLSWSHHRIHRCLNPGKCPLHVITLTKWIARSAGKSCRVLMTQMKLYPVATHRNNPKYSDENSAPSGFRVSSLRDGQDERENRHMVSYIQVHKSFRKGCCALA